MIFSGMIHSPEVRVTTEGVDGLSTLLMSSYRDNLNVEVSSMPVLMRIKNRQAHVRSSALTLQSSFSDKTSSIKESYPSRYVPTVVKTLYNETPSIYSTLINRFHTFPLYKKLISNGID